MPDFLFLICRVVFISVSLGPFIGRKNSRKLCRGLNVYDLVCYETLFEFELNEWEGCNLAKANNAL